MRGTPEKKIQNYGKKTRSGRKLCEKRRWKHGKKINDGTKKTDANTGKEKIDDNKKQNQVERKMLKETKKTSDDWLNNGTSGNGNGHYEKNDVYFLGN